MVKMAGRFGQYLKCLQCDATRDAHCCLPNSTNDDWPAGMILGYEDFRLTLA